MCERASSASFKFKLSKEQLYDCKERKILRFMHFGSAMGLLKGDTL